MDGAGFSNISGLNSGLNSCLNSGFNSFLNSFSCLGLYSGCLTFLSGFFKVIIFGSFLSSFLSLDPFEKLNNANLS